MCGLFYLHTNDRKHLKSFCLEQKVINIFIKNTNIVGV